MKKLAIFLTLIFVFFCGCVRFRNNTGFEAVKSVQIKGSDTVVNLVQILAENFVEQHPTSDISITGGGSGTGFASLINRTCNIAMSSRNVEKNERLLAKANNVEFVEFKIGLDGLVVLVNRNNPVNELTLNQLRSIFMANITNWKEIGGEDRKILVLSRESNSGTHMFFKKHVLRCNDGCANSEFSIHSLMMPSSQAIYDEVCQNSNALGYVGMGFMNTDIKVISVAADELSVHVYPTPESVKNGSYPISRPLYLYTNGNPKGIVKMFIDYVLSNAGQRIILEAGFVPIKT